MIDIRRGLPFTLLLLSFIVAQARAAQNGIDRITATEDAIVVSGTLDVATEVREVQPFEPSGRGASPIIAGPGKFSVRIARFDGQRDRIYSAFSTSGPTLRFVEEFKGVAASEEPYPVAASKKGLQVADVDDAITLGIHHAALNVWLNSFIDLKGEKTSIAFETDGNPYHFHRSSVESLDREVKKLSDAGVVISLILLYQRSGNAAMDKLLLHPSFDPAAPAGISAFNVTTAQSTEQLKACFEFLAQRYARPDRAFGRAVNFIVGNEVDSHWFWYNLGHADSATVAEQYARAIRLCHTAVRKYNAAGRVFISLDHFWNMSYPAADTGQVCSGRSLIEKLHQILRDGGDIDWNIAYHPYPEDLFDARFWRDKTATPRDDTPRITFKNIELLPKYLSQPDMLYHGQPRHVILSEQGFHTPAAPDGEAIQAAAFACAYYRVNQIPGIDALILHRQIDSPAEGGLHLGLWWDAQTNPRGKGRQKKQIYDVFRDADTDRWREAFQFALPIIGIKSWDEVNPIRY